MAAGAPSAISSAQQDVDIAMGVMRQNMVSMSERDSRLNELQGKSDLLQGASGQFSRQAKQLRWEMKWQQYRLAFVIVLMMIWAGLFFIFQHHKPEFLACSTGFAVLAFLVQRFLTKRWRAQMESEDTRQLLDSGEP